MTTKLRLIVLVALLAVAGTCFGLFKLATRTPKLTKNAAVSSASASASAAAPSAPLAQPSASTSSSAPIARDFAVLPDGRPVPPLPSSAPQSVGFGVVLVTYEGAQFAPRKARPKAEARALAEELAAAAKTDFVAAVNKGDPGSMSDAGSVPRGVLEPAAEYVLFTLAKGEVAAAPVDTPRGYWVPRRLR